MVVKLDFIFLFNNASIETKEDIIIIIISIIVAF